MHFSGGVREKSVAEVAPRWDPLGGGGGESNLAPRVQAGDPTTRPDPHGPGDETPNPPFWIKYGSKWKIGFLLKT